MTMSMSEYLQEVGENFRQTLKRNLWLLAGVAVLLLAACAAHAISTLL